MRVGKKLLAGLILLLFFGVMFSQSPRSWDTIWIMNKLQMNATSELEVRGSTDFQSGLSVTAGDVTLTSGDLTLTSGGASVSDSLTLGAGTPVWKVIKSGTDLLLITAADTFVIDSVRAK